MTASLTFTLPLTEEDHVLYRLLAGTAEAAGPSREGARADIEAAVRNTSAGFLIKTVASFLNAGVEPRGDAMRKKTQQHMQGQMRSLNVYYRKSNSRKFLENTYTADSATPLYSMSALYAEVADELLDEKGNLR